MDDGADLFLTHVFWGCVLCLLAGAACCGGVLEAKWAWTGFPHEHAHQRDP